MLWAQYQQDPAVRLGGRELEARTGIAMPQRDVNVLRVKLRRQGWDIEGIIGRNGGYRLMRFSVDDGQY